MFVLDIKEKTNLKLFCYIHIVEIPTNKGTSSYKLKTSKLGVWVDTFKDNYEYV